VISGAKQSLLILGFLA